MTNRLPIPIYNIYDRDIPRQHLHACIIVNPIGRSMKDGRAAYETTVAGCEGASCLIPGSQSGGLQAGNKKGLASLNEDGTVSTAQSPEESPLQ
jgi:hypothetical protein